MTDTPTATAHAFLLVQGASDERIHLGAVIGTRDQAQSMANEMNAARMREAFEAEDTLRRVLPVGVLADPVPAHLFTGPTLHQGDRVRVQYDRGVPDTDDRQYGEIRGIVAKASDDELVVGIHPADNRDGRMLAQAFAATLSEDLLDTLHSALYEWQHGEGGHERLRVFQAAPELTKRLDALHTAYGEVIGEIRPDGVEDDPAAEQPPSDSPFGQFLAELSLTLGTTGDSPQATLAAVRALVEPADTEAPFPAGWQRIDADRVEVLARVSVSAAQLDKASNSGADYLATLVADVFDRAAHTDGFLRTLEPRVTVTKARD